MPLKSSQRPFEPEPSGAAESSSSPPEGRKPIAHAMQRLLHLTALLLEAPRHREELAGLLQRDPTSISRDIGVLRKLGWQVAEHRRKPYTIQTRTMPLFVDVEDARALQHAWEIALQASLPEEPRLRTLLDRVPPAVQKRAIANDARLAFPAGAADYRQYRERIETIRQAIGRGRQMEVVYQVPGKPKPWPFLVDAAELHWVEGALILFAYCPQAKGETPLEQTRELRVDRILELTVTDRACTESAPPKFEFTYRLAPELSVKYRPPVGHRVVEEGPDGVVVEGRELDWLRAQRFLLAFGPLAEVLGPSQFCDRLTSVYHALGEKL